MSCRVISWMKGIFEVKKRKKRVVLTQEDVGRCERMMLSYHKETVMDYFHIGEGTYNNIGRGTHRYSSESFLVG